jgi:hypothetical protein
MIVQKFLPRRESRIESRFSGPKAASDIALAILPILLREAI